jgi:hypothetical protein
MHWKMALKSATTSPSPSTVSSAIFGPVVFAYVMFLFQKSCTRRDRRNRADLIECGR